MKSVQEKPVRFLCYDQRMTKLDEIYSLIDQAEENKTYREKGWHPLYQVSEKSRILLVGQAPGIKAQESMICWHDQSGIRLRNWMGVRDEEFYNPDLFAILPADFYYPGKGKTGDLPPRKFIAEAYHPAMLQAMPNIQMTLLVGKYASDYYLKKRKKRNLTETVAAYKDYLPDYFPIVHPSPLNFRWQKKNPWFVEQVVPELQRRVQKILAAPRG